MRIIFNADDFGYSRAVNFGIIDSYRYGAIRSTTLMTNMPCAKHAALLAKENEGLGVGIHLNLTEGRPLTNCCSSFTDSSGNFFGRSLLEKLAEINLTEVEAELTAQINWAITRDIDVTHLDSHHHIHLHDGVFDVACSLSKKFDIPMRLNNKRLHPERKSPDKLVTEFGAEKATLEFLTALLTRLENEAAGRNPIVEIMCHPGYVDANLLSGSSHNIARVHEQKVLSSAALRDFLEIRGIETVSYMVLRQ